MVAILLPHRQDYISLSVTSQTGTIAFYCITDRDYSRLGCNLAAPLSHTFLLVVADTHGLLMRLSTRKTGALRVKGY